MKMLQFACKINLCQDVIFMQKKAKAPNYLHAI